MGGILSRLAEGGRSPAGTGVSQAWSEEDLKAAVRRGVLDQEAQLLARARLDATARRRLKGAIGSFLAREFGLVNPLWQEAFAESLTNEVAGFGRLEPFIQDESVTEIMVNGPGDVYVEREGRLEHTDAAFRDEEELLELIQRIVAPLGRRVDQAVPYVDARLPDGSRVHAILPPLALGGPYLTIRKFRRHRPTPDDLVASGTLTPELARFLRNAVRSRCNIVIAGGTGSGKTTLLNTLAAFIPDGEERLITIEDAAELQLPQRHVLALEARPANVEGSGRVTVRDLLRNALRMRPDRIIIGEVRGEECFDLLAALNTGHEGTLTTIHANSPTDAVDRLCNMVLTAGQGLPHAVVLQQVLRAVDLIVQTARLPGGQRRVVEVGVPSGGTSDWVVHPLFRWQTDGHSPPDGSLVRTAVDLPPRLLEKAAMRQIRWDGEDSR